MARPIAIAALGCILLACSAQAINLNIKVSGAADLAQLSTSLAATVAAVNSASSAAVAITTTAGSDVKLATKSDASAYFQLRLLKVYEVDASGAAIATVANPFATDKLLESSASASIGGFYDCMSWLAPASRILHGAFRIPTLGIPMSFWTCTPTRPSSRAAAGTEAVGSATDVTRIALSSNLSTYFSSESQLCASATAEAQAAAKAAAANATFSFVGYMGFGNETTVKYGANAAVYVPKDAFKFNLQASSWCGAAAR